MSKAINSNFKAITSAERANAIFCSRDKVAHLALTMPSTPTEAVNVGNFFSV